VNSKILVRSGAIGDTLFDICGKEKTDLLMMGAYGQGSLDRATLGSTAEQLLRSIPCATVTYGPEVKAGIMEYSSEKTPILLPVSFPCELSHLDYAVSVARFFDRDLEVIHVTDSTRDFSSQRELEYQCRDLARGLRRKGIDTTWAVLNGLPKLSDIYINAHCSEHHSPFLLIPLEERNHLSSILSDNVAAQVIRHAEVPVMTYRFHA
jgi:hypothetical protein